MYLSGKGYQIPEDGDDGYIWFASLVYDLLRLNDHTHNGSNSTAIPVTTQSISSGSWSLVSTNNYRQLITLPGSLTFDTISMEFRLSTGDIIYPTVEKVSSTTYYVYTPDNTLNYTAVYSS